VRCSSRLPSLRLRSEKTPNTRIRHISRMSPQDLYLPKQYALHNSRFYVYARNLLQIKHVDYIRRLLYFIFEERIQGWFHSVTCPPRRSLLFRLWRPRKKKHAKRFVIKVGGIIARFNGRDGTNILLVKTYRYNNVEKSYKQFTLWMTKTNPQV